MHFRCLIKIWIVEIKSFYNVYYINTVGVMFYVYKLEYCIQGYFRAVIITPFLINFQLVWPRLEFDKIKLWLIYECGIIWEIGIRPVLTSPTDSVGDRGENKTWASNTLRWYEHLSIICGSKYVKIKINLLF